MCCFEVLSYCTLSSQLTAEFGVWVARVMISLLFILLFFALSSASNAEEQRCSINPDKRVKQIRVSIPRNASSRWLIFILCGGYAMIAILFRGGDSEFGLCFVS